MPFIHVCTCVQAQDFELTLDVSTLMSSTAAAGVEDTAVKVDISFGEFSALLAG